jgi:hypothetical protein
MNLKQFVEHYRQLPLPTQVALVVFALTVIVLVVFFPTAGTSIITFLVAFKLFLTQQ